jgi:hypothetical protein
LKLCFHLGQAAINCRQPGFNPVSHWLGLPGGILLAVTHFTGPINLKGLHYSPWLPLRKIAIQSSKLEAKPLRKLGLSLPLADSFTAKGKTSSKDKFT